MIAERNQYIKSAYNQLQIISQDKKKRLEYEARQKAIWDHNQYMLEAEARGRAEGEKRGRAEGKAETIIEFMLEGQSSDNEIIGALQKRMSITEAQAVDYLKQYREKN